MMGVYVLRHGQPCSGQPSYRKADCIEDFDPPAENVAEMGGCWDGPEDDRTPWIMFWGDSEHGGADVGRRHYDHIWGTLKGPALHCITEQTMWRWPQCDSRFPEQPWGISCFAMTEQEARQAVKGRDRAILGRFCWDEELCLLEPRERVQRYEAIANDFYRDQFPDHHPKPKHAKPPPTACTEPPQPAPTYKPLTYDDAERAQRHNEVVEQKRKRSEGPARSALTESVYAIFEEHGRPIGQVEVNKALKDAGYDAVRQAITLARTRWRRSTMTLSQRMCRCLVQCGACGSRWVVPSVHQRPSKS